MKHFLRLTDLQLIRMLSLFLGCLILAYSASSSEWKPNIVHGSPAKGVTGHLSEVGTLGTVLASVPSLFRESGARTTALGTNEQAENHVSPFSESAPFLLPTCTPPTGLVISEFRLRGPGGVRDEFVELYNNTDAALTICTVDGSSGWAVASADGIVRFVVPANTTIPGRAHYLATGSSYSLGSYAASDLAYASDIPNNTGIALFNTANPANFTTTNRLDAVGFTSDAALYREGAGLTTIGIGNVEYTLRRNLAAGTPADTNNNSADFQFLSTDGSSGSKLSAPGPENLSSPIQRNAQMPLVLLDTTVAASVAPNRVNDFTSDPANNSTYGTLSVRRRIVNNTGAAVSRLRFRVTTITTYPVPSGTADLRARTSTALVTMNVNDSNTCAATGTPSTPPCTVTVNGTTLEQPPNQPLGGGYNSTLAVALPQPLAAGASVNVHFLLGVQQTGNFKFFLNVEASTDSASARLEPQNQTGGEGEDPLSRNFNWSVPLLSLPGRAGLDLGLSLAYNSLVWTKSGSYISFDDDRGFPSPGFRLGFPVIQPLYYNGQAGKNAYLLITPNGDRVELRQVGTSGPLFEAVDSSYLLLDTSTMTLRSTDGTQLSYAWMGSDFQCAQIKDRNGNFITINYNDLGRIDTIVDTLNRTLRFNYDGNSLNSITQTWAGAPQPHIWASFAYRNPDLTIQTNFPGLINVGPQNGSTLKVLSQVTLNDGSRFNFDYTSWGQVRKISNFGTDGHLLNYRSYNLPLDSTTPQTDCPRFTERRDWARDWNRSGPLGAANVPVGPEEEVVTTYSLTENAVWTLPSGVQQKGKIAQVTYPDGTFDKMHFAGLAGGTTGWQRRLPSMVNTYETTSDTITLQRQSVTTWTQDNPSVPFELNPRVLETNVYDSAGNRARTEITYQSVSLPNGTSCKLPQDVKEYQANATTVLRRTRTSYKLTADYLNRRIIGLVSERTLYEVDPNTQAETLMSKVGFEYDETGSIQGTDAPVQHDNINYTASFVVGRANLSSVKRYDVFNSSLFVTSSNKYNTAGAVVETTDPANHPVTVSYADAFAANGTTLDPALGFTTLAYPTTVTDADGYSSSVRYNYDFGAATWKQTPLPNTTVNTPGPQQKLAYDDKGRIERVTNLVNNAYTRFIYGPNYVETFASVNNVADEAHTLQVFDGAGRVIAKASNHPGSTGGFSGQLIIYDNMGRLIKQSNPTETSISISGVLQPYNWQASGDDAQPTGNGWVYPQQTYDWKGRPLVTTNTDGTTKEASYTGCGCAGGSVVTLTDEGTLDAGVPKRRQQKIYSDVLSRTVKTEVLSWQGGSVYSATVNTYNARDQVTLVREFQGTAPVDPNDLSCPSGTCQQTTISYDGHGRLKTRHKPEQQVDPNNSSSTDHTTWDYNPDDTLQKITDARGASQTFSHNNRHLVTEITYAAPSVTPPGSVIPMPGAVTLAYDATGNRTSMTDGLGSASYDYNQLSRMTSETRIFTGLGSYTINYDYNLAGEMKSITDPAGATINYAFDTAGRISRVTGSTFGDVTTYASGVQYRAWGTMKHLTYGNSKTLDLNFNRRLQASSFALTDVMSKTYDYYADGTLRFSGEALDHHYDRSYSYDQAGRITLALSGAEARGEPATNDRPYKQTFSYDGFSHLASRNSNVWNDFYSTGGTYTNNRRLGSEYDADGNLVNDGIDAAYTYDAAGNIAIVQTESWTVFGRDGDGQKVKSEESIFDEATQTNITTTKYYVRSTVLKGQVLTELESNGAKSRTFVYAGGSVLAWQEIIPPSSQRVVWEHRDPGSASFRVSDRFGSVGAFLPEEESAELDPTGANAGLSAPIILIEPPPEDPPPDDGSLVPYPSFSDPRHPGRTYSVDGIPVPIDFFMMLLDSRFHGPFGLVEASARASRRVVGRRNSGVSWGRRFEVIHDANGRIISEELGDLDPDLQGVNYGVEIPIYDSSWALNLTLLPQKSGEFSDPTSSIRIIDTGSSTAFERNKNKVLRKIEFMVNSGSCNAAFKRWGLTTPYDLVNSGKITLSSTQALTNSSYNRVLGQALGTQSGSLPDATRIETQNADGPARTLRNDRTGNAIIFFGSDAFDPSYLDEAVPHEFIHAGGQGGKYSVLGWLFGGHDLSGYNPKAYADIMANCKDH
jgi:YD repeat-containing protein